MGDKGYDIRPVDDTDSDARYIELDKSQNEIYYLLYDICGSPLDPPQAEADGETAETESTPANEDFCWAKGDKVTPLEDGRAVVEPSFCKWAASDRCRVLSGALTVYQAVSARSHERVKAAPASHQRTYGVKKIEVRDKLL